MQGNDSGMNPYAYVGGNPATDSDPTGEMECAESECRVGGGGDASASSSSGSGGGLGQAIVYVIGAAYAFLSLSRGNSVSPTWRPHLSRPVPTPTAPLTTTPTNQGPDIKLPPAVNAVILHEGTATPTPKAGSNGPTKPPIKPPPTTGGDYCSFTPDTHVATANGEQSISKLHVGEKVRAYNPKTKQMELQPIEHVWIHQDSDLVDLTITYQKSAQHGKADTKGQNESNEVVHTTSEHPFYTTEHGFMPAGKLKVGVHILRADGSVGVVTQTKLVHRTQTMYNLEVAHDHTFVVGAGQWVVHNKCGPEDYKQLRENMENAGVEFKAGQQAHHIIPCALENHPLIQATDGLFDKNAAYNGRALYGNNYQEEALQDGEPYHWFHNRYTARVRGLMNQAYQNLTESGALNDPGYGQQMAMTSLLEIIASLDTDIIQQGLTAVWTNLACLLS